MALPDSFTVQKYAPAQANPLAATSNRFYIATRDVNNNYLNEVFEALKAAWASS